MIVLDPKHNWKEDLKIVMEDLGFITTARGKNHIEFSYRLSKIRFRKEHGGIHCNRTSFFKHVDDEARFYPEEYKDACEKRADDKIQRTHNLSALETKVMFFQVELEGLLEKLLPTLSEVKVHVIEKCYRISITFSHKLLRFGQEPSLETLLDNSLFEIDLDESRLYNNDSNWEMGFRLPFKTLQQFLDHIQSEPFQDVMKQLSEYVDQDRKDSLALEIKDLEKSIQWRKSELEKMIQDERNVINKLF